MHRLLKRHPARVWIVKTAVICNVTIFIVDIAIWASYRAMKENRYMLLFILVNAVVCRPVDARAMCSIWPFLRRRFQLYYPTWHLSLAFYRQDFRRHGAFWMFATFNTPPIIIVRRTYRLKSHLWQHHLRTVVATLLLFWFWRRPRAPNPGKQLRSALQIGNVPFEAYSCHIFYCALTYIVLSFYFHITLVFLKVLFVFFMQLNFLWRITAQISRSAYFEDRTRFARTWKWHLSQVLPVTVTWIPSDQLRLFPI